MRYQTAFGPWDINQNDTVSDLQNGLMWARKPLCFGGIGVGGIVENDWETMSGCYGRGVTAYERTGGNLGSIVSATIKHSGRKFGYIAGSKPVHHAGHNDWRLPTLDEVVTISFEEGWGARKVNTGIDDAREIIATLFDTSVRGEQRFWVANMCWQYKGLRTLIGLKPKDPPVAWSFHFGTVITIYEIGHDDKHQDHAALLVRNL